jgi:RND family efflux transporter MFP subunit
MKRTLFQRTPFLRRVPFRMVVAVVTGLIVGLGGCAGPSEPMQIRAKADLPTVEAELVTVSQQRWPRVIRSQGSLTADEVAILGARVEGRVEQVHADLGDFVEVDQPLVSLRKSEFQFRVEQAEAALLQARAAVGLKPEDSVSKLNPENAPPVVEQRSLWNQAQVDLERATVLRARNTITEAELIQFRTSAQVAEARYNAALNSVREKIAMIGVREAELSLAREALRDTEVPAPFAGRVQLRSISPGAYVRVGDPLITLVKTDLLRYRGMIPERYALHMQQGQEVQLQVESIVSPIHVKITRISPALDLSNRALIYEAEIDNSAGTLRTGLFAEARIVIDREATAIVIPRSSLIEFAGAQKVWKVVEGESREQEVLTGERREARVEILQGLEPGDRILRHAALGRPARIQELPGANDSESDDADSSPKLTAEQRQSPRGLATSDADSE